MDYKDFGLKIRQARRERNISQTDLAKLIGIAPSFLGHIERGTRVASLETLVALCNELGVSPQSLLAGSLVDMNTERPTEYVYRERSHTRTILREVGSMLDDYSEDNSSQEES